MLEVTHEGLGPEPQGLPGGLNPQEELGVCHLGAIRPCPPSQDRRRRRTGRLHSGRDTVDGRAGWGPSPGQEGREGSENVVSGREWRGHRSSTKGIPQQGCVILNIMTDSSLSTPTRYINMTGVSINGFDLHNKKPQTLLFLLITCTL